MGKKKTVPDSIPAERPRLKIYTLDTLPPGSMLPEVYAAHLVQGEIAKLRKDIKKISTGTVTCPPNLVQIMG